MMIETSQGGRHVFLSGILLFLMVGRLTAQAPGEGDIA